MAYVIRKRGVGQTTYQGPCPQGLVMDPTSGSCLQPSGLQTTIEDLTAALQGQSTTGQPDYTPFLWIALAFAAISLMGGRR